jgi:hypothetical protein
MRKTTFFAGAAVTALIASGFYSGLALAQDGAAQDAGFRKIDIDAGHSVGTLKPLRGVNGVPISDHAKFFGASGPNNAGSETINVIAGYRDAHVNLIRTHDTDGAGDIDAVFPPPSGPEANSPMAPHVPAALAARDIFPNMDADPNDPKSYNFGPTNQILDAIKDVGAQPLFRIGRSVGADSTPPKDFEKYASIVRHIVLHYNHGWANGYHMGIKYWEVWNEPDLYHIFWGGTPAQFYDLYEKIARAVKAADPTAKVGGPPLALPLDATPYREDFFAFVRKHKVPLDFVAWHWYSFDTGDPYDYNRIAANLQPIYAKYGFGNLPKVVDEWNGAFVRSPADEPGAAAYISAALTYMQDAPIDQETIYRADGYFGSDGKEPNQQGAALIAAGQFANTPLRLSAQGGDTKGFAVLAGKAKGNSLYQVLVTNYEVPKELMGPRPGGDEALHFGPMRIGALPRRTLTYDNNKGFDLTVSNLPRAKSYLVEYCQINADQLCKTMQSDTQTGNSVHLHAALPAPGIELIKIRPQP